MQFCTNYIYVLAVPHSAVAGSFEGNISKCSNSKPGTNFPGVLSLSPAVLAGFLGVGMVSFTDASEV